MYFNDTERYVAQWLRNLWPTEVVDEQSIGTVSPADVGAYTRCHFFAGIGGWEYALQLAGWPNDRPVWTGSCPCQPFSQAGKHGGTADPRHLWPDWLRFIAECRPSTIFGEQVASRAGREWLAGVRTDLEALGYAVGAADLCAAGAGAPHIRQRLFWVADAERAGLQGWDERGNCASERFVGPAGLVVRLADPEGHRWPTKGEWTTTGYVDGNGELRRAWEASDHLVCRDGKTRRVEPGIRPLAHGVPARMGRLRAYGNAIVPQVAATFVRAYLDAQS